jgi:hypothetical protein
MFCPSCNFQNSATNMRCLQCRSVLIESAERESSDAKLAQPTNKSSPNAKAGPKGVIASLLGAAVGVYAGIHVLVPAVGAAVTWLIGSRLLRPAQPAYLPAISTQAAHALWLLIGSAIIGSWDATVGDLVILSVGLIWLWFKPSMWPLAILCIYQIGSLGVNSYALWQQQVGSVPHKALVVHIALRVLALFYMWQGLRQVRVEPSKTPNPSIEGAHKG